jgi:hypothetical protein
MSDLTRSRTLAAAVMVAAFIVALTPSAAGACSCAPVTTADMVENAAVVFVGQEVGRIANRDIWPPVAVSFQVVEAYKGEVFSEMTVWTGGGDADCGVGPLNGLVGIAAYFEPEGRLSFNICGGVHDPVAIAAAIDPIDLADAPDETPETAAGSSLAPWLAAGVVAALVAATGFMTMRRRREWHDGWDSSA